MSDTNTAPSSVLPTDQFDKLLSRLIGLPNGAHTQPTVVQSIDWYGNTTSFMVQTVRTDEGQTAFVTAVNAAGSARYILPPDVLKVIDRQRDSNTTQVRRRHGKRLAEERGDDGPRFTPEMRAKGLETRRKNAAARARKKTVRG